MEITTKGMTTTKITFSNLMTTIYFTNCQKRQLLDFFKMYHTFIYVKNLLECKFQKFALK